MVTKRITIRGKSYIAIWKKGRRGIVSLVPVKKGITKAKVEKSISPQKVPMKRLWRITKAMVCEYEEGLRVGQVRVEITTSNPKIYTENALRKILKEAVKRAKATFPRFKTRFNSWVRNIQFRATERHVIDSDEKRRGTDLIYVDIIGFGLANSYGQLRFKFK